MNKRAISRVTAVVIIIVIIIIAAAVTVFLTQRAPTTTTPTTTTLTTTTIITLTTTTPTTTTTTPLKLIELFKIGHNYEPDTLDLHATTWSDITSVLVYATYFVRDWRNGTFLEWLIDRWELQNNGTVLILHLRPGLKFADGTPINSTAIKYTYDRMINKNAPTLATFGSLNRTEIIDPLTVKLVFNEPFAPLFITLTSSYQGVYDPTYVNNVGDVTYGRKPLAAGPFYVVEWKSGDYILYNRNEYYLGRPDMINKGPVPIKQILIKFLKDPAALVTALETGDVDLITSIPVELYPNLVAKNGSNIIVKTFPGIQLNYFGFNTIRWPFNDVKVRKAIAIILGGEDIRNSLNEINNGLTQPTWGPLVSTIVGYSDKMEQYAKESMYYKQSLLNRINVALQLLKEAGWEDRDKDGILEYTNGTKFEFPLLVPREFYSSREAEYLVNVLKQAGMIFNIRILDSVTIRDMLVKAQHYAFLYIYGWYDAMILRYLFHSTGVKRTWFSTPELDKLLDKVMTTVDPKERQVYIDEVQKILIDNAPWVPLYAPKSAMAWKSQYTNIIINMYEGGTILWEDIALRTGG
jgi:peptide/nickel transport system substrate-binding protein